MVQIILVWKSTEHVRKVAMMKISENFANQSIIIISRHYFEVEDEMIEENNLKMQG